jgi:hypothetical protein
MGTPRQTVRGGKDWPQVPNTLTLLGSRVERLDQKEGWKDETHQQSTVPKTIHRPKRVYGTLQVDIRPGVPASGEALPVVIPSSARRAKVTPPYAILLHSPLLWREGRLPIPIRRIDELRTNVRVGLDDISLSQTPSDTLCKSSWPVDGKTVGDGEANRLVTREVDKLGSDGDRWRAEPYRATIMKHLGYGIPARREDWVFTVCSLRGDKVVTFPIFRKW